MGSLVELSSEMAESMGGTSCYMHEALNWLRKCGS